MRENPDGFRGVFSRVFTREGNIVYTLSLEDVSDYPTRTSIQIGPEAHAEDDLGRYINHACDPTCMVNDHFIVSLKNIHPGDEITFDYSESEACKASPFLCDCCGKLIRGNSI